MSKSKHTPTPWTWDYNEINGPFDGKMMETVVINGPFDGKMMETVVGQEPGRNYESYGPLILSIANAEFIVRACNSYEALVEALKGIKVGGDGGCWCGLAYGDPNYAEHSKKCDAARAALELAGEKL